MPLQNTSAEKIMKNYKKLDPNEIHAGDKVGVLQAVTSGWGYRLYQHWYAKPEVITRITPKRTKFCTESGQEYSSDTTFVALDEYALAENAHVKRFHTASEGLLKIGKFNSNSLADLNDDELETAATCIENLCRMLEPSASQR